MQKKIDPSNEGRYHVAQHINDIMYTEKGRWLVEDLDIKQDTLGELARTAGMLNNNQQWSKKAYKEMATAAMRELELNNLESKILLENDMLAKWWGSVKKDDADKLKKAQAIKDLATKKAEDKKHREMLLSRMTPEEIRVLGIKT